MGGIRRYCTPVSLKVGHSRRKNPLAQGMEVTMIYHSLDNTQIKHSLLATRIGVADGRRPTVFSVAYTCSSVKALKSIRFATTSLVVLYLVLTSSPHRNGCRVCMNLAWCHAGLCDERQTPELGVLTLHIRLKSIESSIHLVPHVLELCDHLSDEDAGPS